MAIERHFNLQYYKETRLKDLNY